MSQSAAPATKNVTHVVKTSQKYCACHEKRLSANFRSNGRLRPIAYVGKRRPANTPQPPDPQSVKREPFATHSGKTSRKPTKKQYLETLWGSSVDKIKKPRENQKTKNQKNKTFQRMFGLRLMFGFFLVLPRFLLTLSHYQRVLTRCFLKDFC